MKTLILFLALLTAFAVHADSVSMGQVVYIPVYSHVYTGDNQREFQLTATITVRNTDLRTPITIASADYYNSAGKLIKQYAKSPVTVFPLSSVKFVINESDTLGGSGAGLVITWKSKLGVNPPLAEAVMIGAKSQQGISFSSRGIVVKELQ